MSLIETRRVLRCTEDSSRIDVNPVALETPLTIMLNDEELATVVCSPYAQKELVMGFLAGEGLIREASDVKDFFYREKQEVVWVETTSAPQEQQANFMRRNFTSCCGKGRPTFYFKNDANQVAPVTGAARFTIPQLLALTIQLEEASHTFQLTGGVHSAALADPERILASFEDIGRHNALDRILGHALLNGIETADKAILLSGRISSEMLIKVARIGTPIVVSRSAPTGLAIDLAEQLNITLIGFARRKTLYVFCHEERITPYRDEHKPADLGLGSVEPTMEDPSR